ncbi:dTMP kinase [Glacieibacterium megasporae]|uniref:dTMP kinase n=1 Tax=Glacieibacterium megasporae TaxID=2835787 RepID=UPI001C1E67B6|nr:dTMP kinase [Polymorphobacter megasporae]UAJ09380.1 dTMP kinase [Polymorphobacter megasporae]
MTGRFITLEGGEGAGKSTQAALLVTALRAEGLEVVATREPGGTPGAEAIRALIVEGDPDRWSALTELLLVNAARADHVARLIRPALERGAWVVCDRYVDSTLAYQGAGKGVPREALIDQHRLATGNLWPDLTLVLDLPVDLGETRAIGRGRLDRFELTGGGFHDRVAKAFRASVVDDPARVRLIDATRDPASVAAAIWAEVEPLLA